MLDEFTALQLAGAAHRGVIDIFSALRAPPTSGAERGFRLEATIVTTAMTSAAKISARSSRPAR